MKDFIMQISCDMGFHGEINEEVLKEAQYRLANLIDKENVESGTDNQDEQE